MKLNNDIERETNNDFESGVLEVSKLLTCLQLDYLIPIWLIQVPPGSSR